MKNRNFALILFMTCLLLSCQSLSKSSQKPPLNKKHSSPVVGSLGKVDVHLNELVKNYQFNAPGDDSVSTLQEFLPSYLVYKAKLEEAKNSGIFDLESLKNEYSSFGKEAAYKYWMENKLQKDLLDEYTKRAGIELKVEFMLAMCSESASPEDTLAAYNKMLAAREQVMLGRDFQNISEQYSSKNRGRSAGGVLNYISVGTTVKPFEDVIYTLPIDSVSMPFRTQYGYHLAKVVDKRDRQQDKKVSHIYFRPENKAAVDSTMEIATAVFDSLESNLLTWAEAIKVYSDDKQSIPKQGEIGWVNYGSRISPTLTDSIMQYTGTKSGDILKPFLSAYGIHIVRVDSIRTFDNEKQQMAFYQEALKQLPRYKADNSQVLSNVTSSLKIEINDITKKQVFDYFTSIDSVKFENAKIESPDLSKAVLVSTTKGNYTALDFTNWAQKFVPHITTNRIDDAIINSYKEFIAEDNLISLTREKYSEFDDTMRNYLNGLAVFKITEDSVWNYAKNDTLGQRRLFDKQKENYQLPERIYYYRLGAKTDSVLNKAVTAVKEGMLLDSLKSNFPNLLVRSDSIAIFDQEPFNHLINVQDQSFSSTFEYKGRTNIFFNVSTLPARTMTFDEAKFRVISDLQDQRGKDWEKSLNAKYSIRTFPENITLPALRSLNYEK